MNTPAHILIGWSLFARRGDWRVILAAIFGGLAPDLSLYLLAGVSIFILDISPNVVFGEMYFSRTWQAIFAVDNSFLVWAGLLAWAYWRQSKAGMALCAAALMHLLLDLPLHHDDGRAHFWPLTGWIYESPLSYWDRQHHADVVAPIAAALAAIAGYGILREGFLRWRSLAVVTLVGMEIFGAAVLFGG